MCIISVNSNSNTLTINVIVLGLKVHLSDANSSLTSQDPDNGMGLREYNIVTSSLLLKASVFYKYILLP